ncbi:uncharacterized protein LOC124818070 [Hydra vulgaris]|uniref:Innexin n=1 Tax=Hydra vulgaris TaxID=6087 RepID=A0A0H5G5F5_HYDVU|nr:uncharacterized protein LOC124818070 [Hydra vulgaris]CRX73274.1 Innexin 6 [Hydra vulgaris]
MSLITGSIKDILSIKLKSRHDAYTDQFSRIFMTKMFIISALIMSVDFFNDKVACIQSDSRMTSEFVHSTCWIQGFYTFAELNNCTKHCGYFGIPQEIQMDGRNEKNELCNTKAGSSCLPMTKVFFVQYQYFPFYIASLSVFYFIPYIFFRVINSDLTSLKSYMKCTSITCPKKIVETYFNYKMNGGRSKLRVKVILNIGVKTLYVIVNVVGFFCTDVLLNYRYKSYGLQWVQWSRSNNSVNTAKPGNLILPAMGICEIYEGIMDKISNLNNKHKFICEISPNILYQYVMLVLWFIFTIGIAISCLGLLLNISSYVVIYLNFLKCHGKKINMVHNNLSIREIEYLRYIRNKDLSLYSDVQRWLKKTRFDKETINFLEINHNNAKP